MESPWKKTRKLDPIYVVGCCWSWLESVVVMWGEVAVQEPIYYKGQMLQIEYPQIDTEFKSINVAV